MADESAAPATPPTPAPAPTPVPAPVKPKFALSTGGIVAVVMAVILLPLVGLLAYDRFHKPVPPPTPPPTPAPAPVETSPVATLTGAFLPIASTGLNAGPDTPLALIDLDAGTSVSTHPIKWKVHGPTLALRVMTPDGGLASSHAQAIVTAPGTYRIHAIARGTTKGVADADVDEYTRIVEGPTPPAPPPTPEPTPTPGPVPTPAPPVPAAPIAGDGLRVLIVYESADLSKYPKEQLGVLYDQSLRDHLAATCPKVGNTSEYRVYDKDASTAAESKTWQDAMARTHPTLPWIVVSNGKTGFEGPLPGNTADTLALIKKYEVKP